MSQASPQPMLEPWSQLPSLGEQLLTQPSVAAWRDLVTQTAAALLSAQADLWLPEESWQVAASGEHLPSRPPSDLMRQALEARQLCVHRQAVDSLPGPEATAAAAPLLASGMSLGVLEVRRSDGSPFSAAELAQLQGLAWHSALALWNRQLADANSRRAMQLSLVRRASAQMAHILDLDQLPRQVTDLVLRTFQYYYVALFVLAPDQDSLDCWASAGPIPPPPDSPAVMPALHVQYGEGIVGHAAQTGREILTNNVRGEPRYRYVDLLPDTQSEMALPLKVNERVLGVLDVQSNQPDAFREDDLEVLRVLASNVALALEHARLVSDLGRRAARFSAVTDVSRAVASILDLDALLKEVVTIIHHRFGHPFVHLFLVDPVRRQLIFRAGSGQRSQVLEAQGLSYDLDDPHGIISWVARHRETVIANNAGQDPRYRPSHLPPAAIYAELAVPLRFGDQILGVLDIQDDRPVPFGDDDRLLFEALADSIAVAVRNANLYRSERWRRQVADSLREVAGLLTADVVLEDVLSAILGELENVLPCDLAAIWLLEDGDLCIAAARGIAADECMQDFSSETTSWLSEALASSGPAVRAVGTAQDPLADRLGFPPSYSGIAAPLRIGERRLGLLTLAHQAEGRYGAESQTILAAFASYAAVAIENTRLYQESQEQALISTAMLQVAAAAQSDTPLDQVLETVVRLVSMLTGAEHCVILSWDERTSAFRPTATHGLALEPQTALQQCSLGDVPALDILRLERTPVVIYDALNDHRVAGTALSSMSFQSLLMVPLLAQGSVLGALLIDYANAQLAPDATKTLLDAQLAIVQGIAHQIASVMENAHLREAQQEEAYVSAALLQVAQAITSLGLLDDILSTVVRIMPILVGVERCVVFLWDKEQEAFRLAQAYGIPSDVAVNLAAQRYAREDSALLYHVTERNERIICSPGDLIADTTLLPAAYATALLDRSPASACRVMAVPLSARGDALGVMMLLEAETGGSQERRFQIIDGIANQVALAVQNERLEDERVRREWMDRELELAREIQQTFIPARLPRLGGWELAARWRAARLVSGDFYDVYRLSRGRLGIFVADVADKGMPAALLMVLARTMMRATVTAELSPAAVLNRVNALLVPDTHHGMFVTGLYAIVSLRSGKVIYANAGHQLPLLWRSLTGQVESLHKGGMALGVLEEMQFDEHTLSMEPGDCLVLYTDGITEAISRDGEMFGLDRLRGVIQTAAGSAAEVLLQAIDQSAMAFAEGTAQADDLTLVVVRRSG